MKRAKVDAKKIPCLMCEKDIAIDDMGDTDTTLADIEKSNFDRGVECRTYGNYGSQVWDMSGAIFFVICDGCLVKHSAKMLVKKRCPQTEEEQVAVFRGEGNPKPRYEPVRNARDYYDEWFKYIDESYDEGDSYYDDVSPYFKK